MLRGEWESIGKEVREGKEWQMNANAGESGEGRLEEVGGGGVEERVWRGQRRRGGEEGEREVRGGEGVGRVGGGEAEGGGAGIRGEEVRRVTGREK